METHITSVLYYCTLYKVRYMMMKNLYRRRRSFVSLLVHSFYISLLLCFAYFTLYFTLHTNVTRLVYLLRLHTKYCSEQSKNCFVHTYNNIKSDIFTMKWLGNNHGVEWNWCRVITSFCVGCLNIDDLIGRMVSLDVLTSFRSKNCTLVTLRSFNDSEVMTWWVSQCFSVVLCDSDRHGLNQVAWSPWTDISGLYHTSCIYSKKITHIHCSLYLFYCVSFHRQHSRFYIWWELIHVVLWVSHRGNNNFEIKFIVCAYVLYTWNLKCMVVC